jgi:hypothetical protein
MFAHIVFEQTIEIWLRPARRWPSIARARGRRPAQRCAGTPAIVRRVRTAQENARKRFEGRPKAGHGKELASNPGRSNIN